jgi:aldehyde oxidoreductase
VIPAFADQPVFAEGHPLQGRGRCRVVGSAAAMAALDLAQFPVTWTELPRAVRRGTEADGAAACMPTAPAT